MTETARPDWTDPTRRLTEMAVTSDLLAGADDLGEVLRRLASRARDVTRADYAAISTFESDGALSRFVYVGMDDAVARRLGSPPVGRGLLGELARHEAPLRIDDVRA